MFMNHLLLLVHMFMKHLLLLVHMFMNHLLLLVHMFMNHLLLLVTMADLITGICTIQRMAYSKLLPRKMDHLYSEKKLTSAHL
jgi:hypothetical protein